MSDSSQNNKPSPPVAERMRRTLEVLAALPDAATAPSGGGQSPPRPQLPRPTTAAFLGAD